MAVDYIVVFDSYFIRRVIKSQPFMWFLILLVLLNTVFVSLEHYEEPYWLEQFLGQSVGQLFHCSVIVIIRL